MLSFVFVCLWMLSLFISTYEMGYVILSWLLFLCLFSIIMSLPFFTTGSHIQITLQFHQGPVQIMRGICIKKRNRGINTCFSLSLFQSLVSGGTTETLIQTFLLYSPYIKDIKVLSKSSASSKSSRKSKKSSKS
jgi:ribosomal protein L19